MIYTLYRYIAPIILILLLTVSSSFAMGKYLNTETVGEADISGEFTLFLYSSGDPIRAAILDIEGDDYTFEMSGSRHNYTVEKSISAEQAMKKAIAFTSSQRYRMRKILDDDGHVTGYELRPLYNIFRYGTSDVLDVDYRITDKKVAVTVDIKSSLRERYERELFRGD